MDKKRLMVLSMLLAAVLLGACRSRNDEIPKPRAYLRIDMPEHEYLVCDTALLPFSFERSRLTALEWKENPDRSQDKWFTLAYPEYKGYLFLSYKKIKGAKELKAQVDTSYRFVEDNFHYSSGVDERRFVDSRNRLFGTTYHLKGQNVASTYQFWLTDSVSHFLRGALYIDVTPNNDSLAPVLEYMKRDIDHLMETVRWR